MDNGWEMMMGITIILHITDFKHFFSLSCFLHIPLPLPSGFMRSFLRGLCMAALLAL
jgi:hypothetical protein